MGELSFPMPGYDNSRDQLCLRRQTSSRQALSPACSITYNIYNHIQLSILSELYSLQLEKKNGNSLVKYWFNYSVTTRWGLGLGTLLGTGVRVNLKQPLRKKPAVRWGVQGSRKGTTMGCMWYRKTTGVIAGRCGSTGRCLFQLAGGKGRGKTSRKKGILSQAPNSKPDLDR